MRVLITGSRSWSDAVPVIDSIGTIARTFDGPHTLVSGACPTGADVIAEGYARTIGWAIERHPADWARYGKAAGPMRNQEMVDSGVDICLAFPLGQSRGTYDCMRRAETAGVPVHRKDAR